MVHVENRFKVDLTPLPQRVSGPQCIVQLRDGT